MSAVDAVAVLRAERTRRAATDEWLALPEKHREEVLWNLRADVESWDSYGEDDEYPGESKIRSHATKLAIVALGGKLDPHAVRSSQ